MKKITRKVVTPVLLAGAIVSAAATAATASIVYPPEGGVWDRGVGTSYVWSDYYHGSICHGSTSVGQTTVSRTAGAGSWSITSARAKLSGNQVYYRTTC